MAVVSALKTLINIWAKRNRDIILNHILKLHAWRFDEATKIEESSWTGPLDNKKTKLFIHRNVFRQNLSVWYLCNITLTVRGIYLSISIKHTCLSVVCHSVLAFYPAMRCWPRARLMHAQSCNLPERASVRPRERMYIYNVDVMYVGYAAPVHCSKSARVYRRSTRHVLSRMSMGAKVHTSKHSYNNRLLYMTFYDRHSN